MAERVREYTVQRDHGSGNATVRVHEREAYQSIEQARADLDQHLMRGDLELAEKTQAEIDRLYETSQISHAAAGTSPTPREAALLRQVELADGSGRTLNARGWVDRFRVLSPVHREMVDRWGSAAQDNAEYFLAGYNTLPKAVQDKFTGDDIPVSVHAAFVEGISALARRAGIIGFTPDGDSMEQPAPRRDPKPLSQHFGEAPPTPQAVLQDLTARQADLMDRGDRAGAQALESQIMEAAAQAGGEMNEDAA